ncbi:uncharacterized protein LOC116917918 isoform X2 [Daphnia magna]|uniref:uncharacterized protein LOC116917918 isoform X2 n=1 Tax=Daphnia magna TaxID=35525 RepID=UPI001E1BB33B|nr:uncharacterized protein LOC116917918 isoform X2 [Daphnia magna]
MRCVHLSSPLRGIGSFSVMSDMKRLFYVWFLGAKECRGLRGDEFVRPIVRYFQRKEEECEPSKVTLQISSKGIKLVADSLRHFVPSHAVTYVSQGAPPDDDIVSVILLLYNPITKCPVHLHAYRCDSVETADLLSEQFQLLVDLPENQRKIRDLEQRLQSQGLYPSAGQSQSRMLIKSCDTGLGGSSGDLLTGHSDSSSDDVATNDVCKSTMDCQRPLPLQSDVGVSKSDQERIARLYDSLAAELRDKLGGAMSGKAAPLLLPPKDYEMQEPETGRSMAKNAAVQSNNNRAGRPAIRGNKQTDNGSSSGLSSGIGSDLDDPVADRSRNREWMRSAVNSQQQPDNRQQQQQLQQARQRYSYHDSSSSNNNIVHQQQHQYQQQQQQEVRRREPVMRQMSERRDTSTLLNRRSMSDLRRQEESAVMIRRREESCRDIRASNAELNRSRADFQQLLLADGNRSRVKEALSKFESRDHQQNEHVKAVHASSRSRSFRDDQPSQGWNAGFKYRRQPSAVVDGYQELDQRERFPGLDRETARVLEPLHGQMSHQQQQQQQRHLQRHKSSEFVSMIKRGPNDSGSVVVVEPTQKVGNRHFRAVRQPN